MPSACLDLSLPPSPLRFFLPPAVQFISCSSPPPPHPCPHRPSRPSRPSRPQRFSSTHAPPPPPMPRLSHSACLDLLLPPSPLPPFPPPALQFISCSSPPPCPVYLIIIVFKHAQCMPRSVPAPIAPPALPAPSGSVHLMFPAPMPRLSHNNIF